MFELFGHTADLGVRVTGASREELFAEAARGLANLLIANLATVRPVETRILRIAGERVDYLLLDWLQELLYLFETEHWLCCEAKVRLAPGELTAECQGEPLDEKRHSLGYEVKAITYHELNVRQVGDLWQAEFIVDI